jgi:hypothetical protein
MAPEFAKDYQTHDQNGNSRIWGSDPRCHVVSDLPSILVVLSNQDYARTAVATHRFCSLVMYSYVSFGGGGHKVMVAAPNVLC